MAGVVPVSRGMVIVVFGPQAPPTVPAHEMLMRYVWAAPVGCVWVAGCTVISAVWPAAALAGALAMPEPAIERMAARIVR